MSSFVTIICISISYAHISKSTSSLPSSRFYVFLFPMYILVSLPLLFSSFVTILCIPISYAHISKSASSLPSSRFYVFLFPMYVSASLPLLFLRHDSMYSYFLYTYQQVYLFSSFVKILCIHISYAHISKSISSLFYHDSMYYPITTYISASLPLHFLRHDFMQSHINKSISSLFSPWFSVFPWPFTFLQIYFFTFFIRDSIDFTFFSQVVYLSILCIPLSTHISVSLPLHSLHHDSMLSIFHSYISKSVSSRFSSFHFPFMFQQRISSILTLLSL